AAILGVEQVGPDGEATLQMRPDDGRRQRAGGGLALADAGPAIGPAIGLLRIGPLPLPCIVAAHVAEAVHERGEALLLPAHGCRRGLWTLRCRASLGPPGCLGRRAVGR